MNLQVQNKELVGLVTKNQGVLSQNLHSSGGIFSSTGHVSTRILVNCWGLVGLPRIKEDRLDQESAKVIKAVEDAFKVSSLGCPNLFSNPPLPSKFIKGPIKRDNKISIFLQLHPLPFAFVKLHGQQSIDNLKKLVARSEARYNWLISFMSDSPIEPSISLANWIRFCRFYGRGYACFRLVEVSSLTSIQSKTTQLVKLTWKQLVLDFQNYVKEKQPALVERCQTLDDHYFLDIGQPRVKKVSNIVDFTGHQFSTSCLSDVETFQNYHLSFLKDFIDHIIGFPLTDSLWSQVKQSASDSEELCEDLLLFLELMYNDSQKMTHLSSRFKNKIDGSSSPIHPFLFAVESAKNFQLGSKGEQLSKEERCQLLSLLYFNPSKEERIKQSVEFLQDEPVHYSYGFHHTFEIDSRLKNALTFALQLVQTPSEQIRVFTFLLKHTNSQEIFSFSQTLNLSSKTSFHLLSSLDQIGKSSLNLASLAFLLKELAHHTRLSLDDCTTTIFSQTLLSKYSIERAISKLEAILSLFKEEGAAIQFDTNRLSQLFHCAHGYDLNFLHMESLLKSLNIPNSTANRVAFAEKIFSYKISPENLLRISKPLAIFSRFCFSSPLTTDQRLDQCLYLVHSGIEDPLEQFRFFLGHLQSLTLLHSTEPIPLNISEECFWKCLTYSNIEREKLQHALQLARELNLNLTPVDFFEIIHLSNLSTSDAKQDERTKHEQTVRAIKDIQTKINYPRIYSQWVFIAVYLQTMRQKGFCLEKELLGKINLINFADSFGINLLGNQDFISLITASVESDFDEASFDEQVDTFIESFQTLLHAQKPSTSFDATHLEIPVLPLNPSQPALAPSQATLEYSNSVNSLVHALIHPSSLSGQFKINELPEINYTVVKNATQTALRLSIPSSPCALKLHYSAVLGSPVLHHFIAIHLKWLAEEYTCYQRNPRGYKISETITMESL